MTPQRESRHQGWFEVLIFTGLALALPAWLTPHDPFMHQADFAWPMLGPLLVALGYGFAEGLVSTLLLMAGQLLLLRSDSLVTLDTYPFATMVGYVLVTMIAGEFRDLWERTNEKQRLQLDYVQDRLDTFTRHYHLLRSSHDRLEQMLAGHGLSLRESLQALRGTLGRLQDRSLEKAARPILELFVEYGGLQSASLYGVENNRITGQALTSVGQVQGADAEDPMVKAMLEQGQLVSINQLSDRADQSRYQIAIPLADVRERIYAVLLVEQVQFFALRGSSLTLMSVMAGHVGDMLRHSLGNPVLGPADKARFLEQIKRCQREAKRYGIPAQLLKIQARQGSEEGYRVLEHVNATRRGLDIYLYDPDQLTLLLLMPLADDLEQAGFVTRVNSWAIERLGRSLDDLDIQVTEQLSLPVDFGAVEKLVGEP